MENMLLAATDLGIDNIYLWGPTRYRKNTGAVKRTWRSRRIYADFRHGIGICGGKEFCGKENGYYTFR